MMHNPPEIEITAAAGSKWAARSPWRNSSECSPRSEATTCRDGEKRIRPVPEDRPMGAVRYGWLWWSGLRLEEAMTLTWDDPHAPYVDLDGENSTITIPGACQKSGKETVGPIVPEFFEFLDVTPEADRTGPVFVLPFRRKDTVSKVITAIGRAAGVKVGPKKCASAHDCRRSFGFRWAVRVMPVVLQKLMRHANIETTLKYYVGNDAREMGKAVWQAFRAANKSERSSVSMESKEATF